MELFAMFVSSGIATGSVVQEKIFPPSFTLISIFPQCINPDFHPIMFQPYGLDGKKIKKQDKML